MNDNNNQKIQHWAESIADGLLSQNHFDRNNIILLLKSNLRLALTDILSDRSEIEVRIIQLKTSLDTIENEAERTMVLNQIRVLKTQKNDAKRVDRYSSLCRLIYKKYGSKALDELKNEMRNPNTIHTKK